MRTVLYFEWNRYRKSAFFFWLIPVLMICLVFIGSIVIEKIAPEFNRSVMRWPDIVKDLLSLPGWNSSLFWNFWQIFILFFPIFMIYLYATKLTDTIVEEERLETSLYLHNMSITKATVISGKWLFWAGVSLIGNILFYLFEVLFCILLKTPQMMQRAMEFSLVFSCICIFYFSISVFLASFHKTEVSCHDWLLFIVIVPLILSRAYAILTFFANLMIITGREGSITEKLFVLSERSQVMIVLSPITWCWSQVPTVKVYGMCAVIVGCVLWITGISIYRYRHN